MNRDLRDALRTTPAPGEREAGRRAMQVVRRAYAERPTAPPPPRRRRRSLAVAAVVLAGAAIATPPGVAVSEKLLHGLRGRLALPATSRPAASPLRLPASGRLLVVARGQAWIVRANGSRRRVGAATDATWSPHGRNVLVRTAHRLSAWPAAGRGPAWAIPSRDLIAQARWSGGNGFRVAFVAGGALHVMNGDGTGRHTIHGLVAPLAPAWQPQPAAGAFVLAVALRDGRVRLLDTDAVAGAGRARWTSARRGPAPTALAFTADGRRLLVLDARRLRVLDARRGRELATLPLPRGARGLALAVGARGPRAAVLVAERDGSSAVHLVDATRGTLAPRALIRLSGRLDSVALSPDGRWLAVGWPRGDALLFTPLRGGRPLTVGGVAARFGGAAPLLRGWVP